MYDLDHQRLTLPITDAIYQRAQSLAQQQPTPQKAAQILNNTLAISLVESYLDLMGIATDRTLADSHNPVIRLCADVADLEVTDLGRLECRPVSSTATICPVPPETWEDRIGYVVVQIGDDYREADLLGFAPTATGDLPLAQLEPMEDLLSHLDQLRRSRVEAPQDPATVPLSQWVGGLISAGWQAIEALVDQGQLTSAFSFRGGVEIDVLDQPTASMVRRARVLDWDPPLTIFIELTMEPVDKVSIRLQIYPVGQLHLPPHLELQILDELGQPFLTAQSRDGDSYIQLQFRGDVGERFSLALLSGDLRFTEVFVI